MTALTNIAPNVVIRHFLVFKLSSLCSLQVPAGIIDEPCPEKFTGQRLRFASAAHCGSSRHPNEA